MMCSDCNKNPSTVHYTEIINNKKTVLDLCSHCAEKRGFSGQALTMPQTFGVENLVSKIAMEFETERNLVECPSCHLRYEDFKKTGKLGCGKCYTTFGPQLDTLFRKIHGADTHIGKAPGGTRVYENPEKQLETLRTQIKKAIQQEDFERAARLRDEISRLGKQQK